MIFAFNLVAVSLLIAIVNGVPTNYQQPQLNNPDAAILNFALTLELLEASFYQEGLRRFPEAEMRRAGIVDAGRAFRDLFHIFEHEQQHVITLASVIKSLGARPVSQCQFRFNLPDVKTFITVARSLEKVGVSAYTGALSSIQDKKLQTAGATIGTVEARHAALLNALNNIDPAPEAFDVPLTAAQVLTLASPFIVKCDLDLGIKAFTALSIKTATAKPGDYIIIDIGRYGNYGGYRGAISCNFVFSDQNLVTPLRGDKCQIPNTARGDIYVNLIRGDKPPSPDNLAIIIAGPAIFPVDTFALDSCPIVHNSKNRKVRVNVDVDDYGLRRDQELRDILRRLEDNRTRLNGEVLYRAPSSVAVSEAPSQS